MKIYNMATMVALIFILSRVTLADTNLDFAFTVANQSGTPGSSNTFGGTLTNNTGITLYPTFDSMSLSPVTVATYDDTVFFNNVTSPYLSGTPLELQNGASILLQIFSATIKTTASVGATANGIISIDADTSSDPNNPGATFSTSDVPFSVTVAAVPEPTSTTILEIGALALISFSLRMYFKNRTRSNDYLNNRPINRPSMRPKIRLSTR